MGFLGWGGIGQGLNSAADNFTKLFLGMKQIQEEKAKREAQQNLWNAQVEELKAQAAQRQQDLANRQNVKQYVSGLLQPQVVNEGDAAYYGTPAAAYAEPPDTRKLLTGMLAAGADPEKIGASLAAMANTDVKMQALLERQELKNDMWQKYIEAKQDMEAAKTKAQQDIAQAKLDNALEQIRLAASLGKWNREDKDPNIAMNRAQQMAQRDLKTKYAYDNLTGQYLDDSGKPVPRATILKEYTDLYNRYMGKQPQDTPVSGNNSGVIRYDKNGRRIQ